ncbi:hypothetical protein ABNN70_12800 [Sporolactobacillus sp. Y61]|jgi:hypothetical protein|uniref:DUF4190 domain-containing protein n=1 Tax=Sporolactobacillus sp. Y61 TaxID=3160863 RepID=A0AAU8IEW4_9BACL|nr:hypothetical protein [Sporolactobacillus sp. THM19-2]RYL90419.1 hypothetical protein EWH91_09705 [Sporolactobacillus sp. THM19-2]
MAGRDHDEESLYDKRNAYNNEEYAKELAADQYDPEAARRNRDDKPLHSEGRRSLEGGTGIGWLALIISACALFFLPIVLGIAGIIIGYVAYRQGARTLGGWAIGIGIVAVLIQLLSPLFW